MSSPVGAGGASDGEAGHDLGGDPVCWLDRVCPECGSFAEGEPPPARCSRCGADLSSN